MFNEKEMASSGLNDDDDLHELLEPLDVKPINSRPGACPLDRDYHIRLNHVRGLSGVPPPFVDHRVYRGWVCRLDRETFQ